MTKTLACFLVLLLSGCVSFHPEPLSTLQTLSVIENRSPAAPGLREFSETNLNQKISKWPPPSWDFDTLTLMAFYYHSDLDIARAKWKGAKAAIVTAGGRPNPSVGFSPQYNFNAASGISPWIYGVTFDIPIETMGKRKHRISQARNLAQSAKFNFVMTAWQIRSRLWISLAQYEASKETLLVLKDQTQAQEEYVKFLQGGLLSSRIANPDLWQAQIAFNRSRIALVDAERLVNETKTQLADALGLPNPKMEDLKIAWDNKPAGENFSLQEIRKTALLSRPDIQASLAEYDASQSALQLEIDKQYPDIHIGPGYTWDQGQNKWAAGITITLPVLNRNQGPIAEALAKREEAKARLIALQGKAIAEIERGFENYQSALKKLKTAGKLFRIQEKQTRHLKAMLKTGEAIRFAWITSEAALDSARLSYIDALTNERLALGGLEDAIQKPLRPSRIAALHFENLMNKGQSS